MTDPVVLPGLAIALVVCQPQLMCQVRGLDKIGPLAPNRGVATLVRNLALQDQGKTCVAGFPTLKIGGAGGGGYLPASQPQTLHLPGAN